MRQRYEEDTPIGSPLPTARRAAISEPPCGEKSGIVVAIARGMAVARSPSTDDAHSPPVCDAPDREASTGLVSCQAHADGAYQAFGLED